MDNHILSTVIEGIHRVLFHLTDSHIPIAIILAMSQSLELLGALSYAFLLPNPAQVKYLITQEIYEKTKESAKGRTSRIRAPLFIMYRVRSIYRNRCFVTPEGPLYIRPMISPMADDRSTCGCDIALNPVLYARQVRSFHRYWRSQHNCSHQWPMADAMDRMRYGVKP